MTTNLFGSNEIEKTEFTADRLAQMPDEDCINELRTFFVASIEGCGSKEEYLRRFALYANRVGDNIFMNMWREYRCTKQALMRELKALLENGPFAFDSHDEYLSKLNNIKSQISEKEFARAWYTNEAEKSKHLT